MAAAQAPTFRLDTATITQGQTSAQVGLYISGGVANTAAFNVTIDVTSGADKLNGNITGVKDPALTNFTYVQNSIGGTQYRAVLYAPNSSTTFNTTNEVKVATLTIPVSSTATPGTIGLTIANKFDSDAVTGLTGLGDSAGNSIHGPNEIPSSNGARQINATNGGVTVNAINPGTTIEFCSSNSIPNGWEFAQVLPIGDPDHLGSSQMAGMGHHLTLLAKNAFGFVQTIDSDATVIPSPGDGQILRSTFAVASNQSSAFNNVPIRLRAGARDASFTQTHTFQEGNSGNTAPITVPLSTDAGPRNLELVYYCPDTLTNNIPTASSNGIILAFDLLQFGDVGTSGAVGARYDLKSINYTALNPNTLTNEDEILSLNFVGNAHNFTPIDFKPDNSAITGIFPSNLGTTGGLTINNATAPVGDLAQPSGLKFSFGIWEKTFNQASGEPWEVAADKLYKVTFTLASNAPGGTPSHTARLRFTVGDNDFVGDASVNALQDQTFDPRGSGKTYTAFVKFPNALAGLPVKLSYDVFWVNPGVTNTGITLTLTELHVFSYDNANAPLTGPDCPN
ncbi:hypothetical protein IT570_10920 [Candidatus Sumerlaeota bacterium]|nr:hypothetical protein [Candidatus Sumerlaeota bacterium]